MAAAAMPDCAEEVGAIRRWLEGEGGACWPWMWKAS